MNMNVQVANCRYCNNDIYVIINAVNGTHDCNFLNVKSPELVRCRTQSKHYMDFLSISEITIAEIPQKTYPACLPQHPAATVPTGATRALMVAQIRTLARLPCRPRPPPPLRLRRLRLRRRRIPLRPRRRPGPAPRRAPSLIHALGTRVRVLNARVTNIFLYVPAEKKFTQFFMH